MPHHAVFFSHRLRSAADNQESKMSKQIELTVKAKAFSGEGVRTHQVMVEDKTVRVYDPVAGYYTNCHSLSTGAQQRIVKLAQQAA
jgi:hypothetical protein